MNDLTEQEKEEMTALGALVVQLIANQAGEATIGAIFAGVVTRMGHEWARNKLDYMATLQLAADESARAVLGPRK